MRTLLSHGHQHGRAGLHSAHKRPGNSEGSLKAHLPPRMHVPLSSCEAVPLRTLVSTPAVRSPAQRYLCANPLLCRCSWIRISSSAGSWAVLL